MTVPVPVPGRRAAAVAVGVVALTLAGCGGSGGSGMVGGSTSAAPAALAPDLLPLRAGRTAAYRLPPSGEAVTRRRALRGLTCRRRPSRGPGLHIELYARRLVVPVPAGIGVAPPLRRSGAYVQGGSCAYPIRTYEPTGLVVIDRRPGWRLADLFAVWGQPLSPHALTGFHGPVRAYLGGRIWGDAPGRILLRPHAEIVLEVGAFVPPHPRYAFPRGR